MKILKLVGVLTLCIVVLSACAGNGSVNQAQGKSLDTKHKSNMNESPKKSSNHSDDASEQGNENKDGASESPENQLNLKIGDTGIVKSNISKYKITLDSVKVIKGPIGGESPQSDQYILAEITIKNTGDKKMNVEDAASELNLGGGSNNIAGLIHGIDALKGKLAPGETIKGEALFDIYKAKKYKLIDGIGLADKGAGLQNKVIWTFKASEAK